MTDETLTLNRQRLYEVALGQHGYVTSRDAVEAGVSRQELVKLGQRRGITRVGHGVYHFDDYPPGPLDEFMEAVLLVGADAFLVDVSVLAMHDLAMVNPRRIRVGTTRRVRRATLSALIEIVPVQPDPSDLTTYEGIPSTTISRALLDCRGRVMRERLVEGAKDARARGLISGRTTVDVLRELER